MHPAIALDQQVREFLGYWATLPERHPGPLPSDALAHRWIVGGLATGALTLSGRPETQDTAAVVAAEFLKALEAMLAVDLA